MRISYDEESRGLIIAFGDPARYRVSKEIVPGVVVDFDEGGKALAVELEDVDAVLDPREVRKLVYPQITRGTDLKDFRERLGLTQGQLGDLIDVPRNTVARWEREELPIAKARQLELALSAILRPEMDRTFSIVFRAEDDEGDLECGFCGQIIPLPLGFRPNTPAGDPRQIITQHYDPGPDDDTEKLPRCRNWHRWKSSWWEIRNSDDNTVIAHGAVHVARDGAINVESAPSALRKAR